MNYYNQLKTYISKSAIKRLTSLNPSTLGKEALYTLDGELLVKSGEFKITKDESFIEEIITLKPELVLFGGGHIGRNVAQLASLLDLPCTIFEDRESILADVAFKECIKHCDTFTNLLSQSYEFNNPYYLIFTHGHLNDLDCLRYALKQEARYIGMIGSKQKIAATYEKLRAEGFTNKDFDRVHAPIGLKINATTPEEIAISIMAEIINNYSVKHQVIYDIKILNALCSLKTDAVLCTIVDTKGSAPRKTGSSMLITPTSMLGSIGGGAIENQVITDANDVFKTKTNKIVEYNLNDKSNLGMICGGENTVLFQYIK